MPTERRPASMGCVRGRSLPGALFTGRFPGWSAGLRLGVVMRAATLMALLTASGCDDTSSAPFDPIGRPADAAVAPQMPEPESDPTPEPEPAPEQPLQLDFVPIEHDAGALRITDLAFLPGTDGEFVVLDKDGDVIHMRLDGDGAIRLGAFRLDDVWSESDAGLISVAVDPDFAQNRFIYLGYTPSRQASVIRRYRLAGDHDAVPASAVDVFAAEEPRAPRSWHNIGKMGFDDDGVLWALFGDKVIDENAADPHSPLGALVRLVPLPEGGFDVPPDNPYLDGSGHPTVYAKGFRSPWTGFWWRGSFVLGDVGLDRFEEINRIDAPGLNFGWPDFEGPCPAGDCAGTEPPWLSYGRGGSDRFVLDDPQATSSRLRSVWVAPPRATDAGPDPYDGRWDEVMLFGDAFVGYVRGRSMGGGESWPVGHLHFATAFATGPDGYVYATALGTWPVDAPVVPSPILRAVPTER